MAHRTSSFDFIELTILVVVAVVFIWIVSLAFVVRGERKAEFMEYCKGQDVKEIKCLYYYSEGVRVLEIDR